MFECIIMLWHILSCLWYFYSYYTSTVKHVCDAGYISTEGNESIERVCQADGTWSDTNLTCEGMTVLKSYSVLISLELL